MFLRLWSVGSVVVVHWLSCSVTCGIFLYQGSNLCLLQQQVDSLPLRHHGSPKKNLFLLKYSWFTMFCLISFFFCLISVLCILFCCHCWLLWELYIPKFLCNQIKCRNYIINYVFLASSFYISVHVYYIFRHWKFCTDHIYDHMYMPSHFPLRNWACIWPSNPTPGHTHQGNQIWKRHVHPNVHHSTVYHSQDMEAT